MVHKRITTCRINIQSAFESLFHTRQCKRNYGQWCVENNFTLIDSSFFNVGDNQHERKMQLIAQLASLKVVLKFAIRPHEFTEYNLGGKCINNRK